MLKRWWLLLLDIEVSTLMLGSLSIDLAHVPTPVPCTRIGDVQPPLLLIVTESHCRINSNPIARSTHNSIQYSILFNLADTDTRWLCVITLRPYANGVIPQQPATRNQPTFQSTIRVSYISSSPPITSHLVVTKM